MVAGLPVGAAAELGMDLVAAVSVPGELSNEAPRSVFDILYV